MFSAEIFWSLITFLEILWKTLPSVYCNIRGGKKKNFIIPQPENIFRVNQSFTTKHTITQKMLKMFPRLFWNGLGELHEKLWLCLSICKSNNFLSTTNMDKKVL